MTHKRIELTKKEKQRAQTLIAAQGTERTNKELAASLGLSVRQVQRLKKALREEGPIGLAHGNRGSEAAHALSEETGDLIVHLYKTKYTGFNFTHFHEKLTESEGIEISRPTVARTLRKAGYKSPRKRRANKHRSRRERRASEGAMLQLDGSPHDWLEGRGPRMCLVGAIDDATGKVVGAVFRRYEDAQGYFLMMRQVVTRYGIPETVYRDRHGVFERDAKQQEELWEQIEGKRAPTQFGRLMEELGIRQIPANSPQAKGRIERLWATFQDRLVSELRLANACTMEEANIVLAAILKAHNNKFHRQPKDPNSVYRKPERGVSLDELFCFKYRRTVAKDNTIAFFGRTIQIARGSGQKSYAGCWVEVQERFDGSLHLYHRGRRVANTDPPPIPPETLRVRQPNGRYTEECPWTSPRQQNSPKPAAKTEAETGQTKANKPAANHPWRRPWVT